MLPFWTNAILWSEDGIHFSEPLPAQQLFLFGSLYVPYDSLFGEPVTDKPVTHVAYTSSFFDRVSGGKVFADEGAEVIAQANCKSNLMATLASSWKAPPGALSSIWNPI